MRIVLFVLLLVLNVEANQHPFSKNIHMETIEKATLVQVALDNEIYSKSKKDFSDLRLVSKEGEEGYFLKSVHQKYISNQKRLTPAEYDRENATLTFKFKKPFDVEKIHLQIEDRNFESKVDVFVNGKLVVKSCKIFDYSRETGNRNFNITLPKTEAREIKIRYALDKTASFYKKYQNLQELSKYLSIKSSTFSNSNRATKDVLLKSKIRLENLTTKEKKSSYIFKTNNIPFKSLKLEVVEQNFKRNGKVYSSNDGIHWSYLKSFSILSSSISQKYQKTINVENRSKYLKLEVENRDNKPLTIQALTLLTKSKYLYFLAQPNEKYTLYFGQKSLTKLHYELESLVNEKTSFVKAKFDKFKVLKIDVIEKKEEKISFMEANKELLFIGIVLFALGVMGYIAFGLLKRES